MRLDAVTQKMTVVNACSAYRVAVAKNAPRRKMLYRVLNTAHSNLRAMRNAGADLMLRSAPDARARIARGLDAVVADIRAIDQALNSH